MADYYYSGQGCLFEGLRNVTTGRPEGLRMLGNVPALEITIDTTKFEHKESKTGARAIDLTIIQEKNVTFTMTLEDMDPYNLALAMWGTRSVVPAGVDTDTVITNYAYDLAIPLLNPDLLAAPVPTINTAAAGGGTTLVEGTDYTIDLKHGTVTFIAGGGAVVGTDYFVTSSYNGYVQVDALTETSMERYLRFHGLNTIDGEAVIVDMYRASLDPLNGYALINEEIAQLEITGNILVDSLRTAPNVFFQQINTGAVQGAP